MAFDKAPTRAKIRGGTIEQVTQTEVVTVAVDLSGSKTPAYWRALGVGTHGPYTMTKADLGLSGTMTTGQVRAIVDSLDTAIPVVLKVHTNDGGQDQKRISTSESNWGGWRKKMESGVAASTDLANGSAVPVTDATGETVWAGPQRIVNADAAGGALLTVERTVANWPIIALYQSGGDAAAGSQGIVKFDGKNSFDHSRTTFAQIGSAVSDDLPSAMSSRLFFSTYANDTQLSACCWMGLGLYTGGCTDNGVDSMTSKTQYLKAATAPSSPAVSGSWVLYVDSGDGNKLKAKASTGTVVTLGTP